MSKKLIKVWTSRLNKDLERMGHKPITTSQFRQGRTGLAVLDEIIELISKGDVEYAA